ncbi:putative Type II restriction enzyme, methylase subunit, partial [Lactobacillus helveticus MTCC 5463]
SLFFIYHNVHQLVKGGYAGYMTPLVWMFIKTYEPLRHDIINNFKIDSLIQMEYSAFEEATVPIDTFVLKNSDDKIGTYLRLSNFKGGMIVQEQKVLEAISDPTVKYLYHTDQSNFNKIPGSPIAYWASENLINDFERMTQFSSVAQPRAGMITGNNKLFLKMWQEVSDKKIGINISSREDAKLSLKKWFPYSKGGSYKKWYGNETYVVNWENDGQYMRNLKDKRGKIPAHAFNLNFIFKPNITWNALTSSLFSARVNLKGHLYDASGSFANVNEKDIYYIAAFLNSKISNYILKVLNPTINFQKGNIANLPFEFKNKKIITKLGRENTVLSKQDWDAFETSWDFQKSPLLTQNAASLHQAYNSWSDEALTRFNQLKSNEEELNRIFINLYGLQDELTPEEDDKEVSVRKADQVRDIKAFLSYFIGCVFGRYSLDQDGLIYAGGDWDDSKYTTFKPNKENIILLTDRQYFDDDRDIIVRLKEFLTKTFDPETLTENMDFIAQTLEP